MFMWRRHSEPRYVENKGKTRKKTNQNKINPCDKDGKPKQGRFLILGFVAVGNSEKRRKKQNLSYDKPKRC